MSVVALDIGSGDVLNKELKQRLLFIHARYQHWKHPIGRVFDAAGEFAEGFGFDLPHAFAGQPELLADFLQRVRLESCRGRTAFAARSPRAGPSSATSPSRA